MVDLIVLNPGESAVMVLVATEAASAWVEENVELEPWQWVGQAFAVEPRMLDQLLEGAVADGLTVS